MIKAIGIGVWATAVALGATFGMLEWQKMQAAAEHAPPEVRLQQVKTKAINVPIINNGYIQGYMVAQFVFTVDGVQLDKINIDPQSYLLDEAFRTIYAGEKIDYRNLKKQDLPALAKGIGENVNKRLGHPVVQEVLFDQLAFVPKQDMRGPPASNQ